MFNAVPSRPGTYLIQGNHPVYIVCLIQSKHCACLLSLSTSNMSEKEGLSWLTVLEVSGHGRCCLQACGISGSELWPGHTAERSHSSTP